MNIENLGITKKEILDLLDSKIENLLRDEEYEEYINKKVDEIIQKKINAYSEALDQVIKDTLNNIIDRAIYEVDSYGDRTNKKTSLKDLVYKKLYRLLGRKSW